MKKILVFSYDYPPNDGGIARLTHQIAANLHRHGYDVSALTSDHQGNNTETYNTERIPTHRIAGSRWKRIFEAYRYIRHLPEKESYIIICGLWWPEGIVAALAGSKHTFILTHAAELRTARSWFREKIWIPIVANWTLRRAEGVIANSAYTAQLSRRVSPRARVFELPLAVDHAFFAPATERNNDSDCFRICTVARICMFKGFDTILAAIEQLPNHTKQKIRWEIAGSGPDTEQLRQLIEQSSVADRVSMLGFVADAAIPELYRRSDLFALCTREDDRTANVEGFGLVFLEAQACGIPVVGTNAGGIPSAIEHGNGGWLIDTTDQLATLLNHLVEHPDECRTMGEKARRRAETSCTWQHYLNSLSEIIHI